MVSISIIASALLPFITTVIGAPAELRPRETPGNVYICNETNWGPECTVLSVGLDNCMPLPAPYFENVGSVGPDRGAICRLFDGANENPCTGSGLAILYYPGRADLVDARHKARYIKCRECTNCT